MPTEVNAIRIANAVKEGFKRNDRFNKARAMFIKDYAGQYYAKVAGITGEMPINLIFLAIRILIPNLVMREGVNRVTTDFLKYKEDAELLGLALDRLQKQTKRKKLLRGGCVNMCFGAAIFKTFIDATGELLPIGDNINADPGQLRTDLIDNDDFVADPLCTNWDKPTFLGHRVRIERQKLLDTNGWDHDFVRSLPSASTMPLDRNKVEQISAQDNQNSTMHDLQDYVYVVELWVPEAQAIAYIADPYQKTLPDFLNVKDYYGPDEGPYTISSLTPEVPNNPYPIAPVGVWRDLNDMANRIMKKTLDQSDRQKDVILYDPAMADVAEAIRTAPDGECIASNNPQGVNTISLGGQNPDNERMVAALQTWFNYIAGNPEQMGGVRSVGGSRETATKSQILQSNASISTADMQDIVYDLAADISRKESWYLLHDPLMYDRGKSGMPLIRRTTGGQEVQVILTPGQIRGDWEEYTFNIVKRSMQIVEPNLRSKRIMEFYTNVVPSIMTSAQIAMQMGVEFNVTRALMQAADELGIADSMGEIFNDPTFQQRMAIFMQMGPKETGKGVIGAKGIIQNEGFPMARNILSPGQEMNKEAQSTAALSQSALRI